jgi:hypothetical protein
MKFSGLVTLRCRAVAVVLSSASLLVACEKPNIPVNVHGVNYGDDAFTYVVTDPINSANAAGGELIDSYSAGGTMCCYDLPRKWKPGMKLSINVTHHIGKLADNSLHDVRGTDKVEIPRYLDGKPGVARKTTLGTSAKLAWCESCLDDRPSSDPFEVALRFKKWVSFTQFNEDISGQ